MMTCNWHRSMIELSWVSTFCKIRLSRVVLIMHSEFIACKYNIYTNSTFLIRGFLLFRRKTGKCTRNLFTKKFGHTDWVTSCKFLQDGRVWSAGMDNLLCLWDAKAVRCQNLVGHNSTISKILVDNQNIGISASYDASLLVWNLDTKECAQGLFNAHKDPIVEFEWRNSLVVSGDRGGSMAIWDINTG